MMSDDLAGPGPLGDPLGDGVGDAVHARDGDDRWIGDALRAYAGGYELNVEALLDRLSEECGPLRAQPSDSAPAVVSRPVGPRTVRWRPRAVLAGQPPRAPLRRSWLQVSLAAAVSVAVILGGSAVVGLGGGDQRGRGPAQVADAGTTTPGPTRPDGTGPAFPTGLSASSTHSVPPLPPATSTTAPGSATSNAATASAMPSTANLRLPTTPSWDASGPIIGPRPAAADRTAGLKDPTVVYHDGRWHVFATAIDPPALGLVHLSFTDWSQAASARQDRLEVSGIGTGYRAAPQVFWFAPQKLWYLVYQTGSNASYSTNPDLDDPQGWSVPKNFYAGVPKTISGRLGSGTWVDMWVVCDSTTCHLFSTDTNGSLYRSQTSLRDFPQGMSEPVVALEEPTGNGLLDGAAVYRLAGGGEYLLLAEAIDTAGHRYTRSWQAATPSGPWTPRRNPFATAGTVTFRGSPWTQDIAQGELLRAGVDQTMAVNPCRLRYLVSGRPPGTTDPTAEWRIGLLAQAASPC